MQIRCTVIDDDEICCDLIASYVEANENLVLTGKYYSPLEAMKHLLKDNVQLIISDVKMPAISGLDMIKSMKSPPCIIFISSHSDYAIDSYEVNAVDYMKKPVEEWRFTQAINKAIEIIEFRSNASAPTDEKNNLSSEDDYFIIKPDSNYIKLKFTDVLFIEAMVDFIKIRTTDKSYTVSSTLKNAEEVLPSSTFLRVHRSFIVNLDKIQSFNSAELKIGNNRISIGASYRQQVMEQLVGRKEIRKL